MIKTAGTADKPAFKILPIGDCKVSKTDKGVYLEGYANTKNVPDRYGDVPAIYKRNFVYDLSEYKKNPVLLIDHQNSIANVAGSMEAIDEDERGLKFRAKFMDSPLALVQHTVAAYMQGHAKGISIAGRFSYENPEDPSQLTLAQIFEISCVAVPADPNSLAAASEKAAPDANQQIFSALKRLESGATLTAAELQMLREFSATLAGKVKGLDAYDPALLAKRVEELKPPQETM
jgi:HK97 family phage prohead protease